MGTDTSYFSKAFSSPHLCETRCFSFSQYDLKLWKETQTFYFLLPLQSLWCPIRSLRLQERLLVYRYGALRTWTWSQCLRTSMATSIRVTPTSCCTPPLHPPTIYTCGWVSDTPSLPVRVSLVPGTVFSQSQMLLMHFTNGYTILKKIFSRMVKLMLKLICLI